MTIPAMAFMWDGEAMQPMRRGLADKHYVVGEKYILEQHKERSTASHSHYFAALTETWRNLPEDVADQFPTAEHLRKWCLIKAGFADERSIVCASKAEAQRVAAFIKPMDEYALVTVRDATVRVYTAQSQSTRAMNAATFQRSKEAVLEIAAGIIGTTPEAVAENARSVA